MATPLSLITLADFQRLNGLALSDAPASRENLSRLISELARANHSEQVAGVPAGVLVIADQTIPLIRSYSEVEAILEFPENLQHPVEQVSACFSLLRRHEFNAKNNLPQTPMRIPQEQVQRRLSHLLVEYPVLMDDRLVLGIRGPVGTLVGAEADWSTIACALAETSFASLPRLADGLTARELRLFAANASVRAGLASQSPRSNATRSSVRGRTPLEVATGHGTEPSIARATRGAFLTSLLQLNAYSKQQAGRAVVHLSGRIAHGDDLYRSLAKVFWDVATNLGMLSNVTRREFVETMQLESPFALTGRSAGTCAESDRTVATAIGSGGPDTSMLRQYLALTLDVQLFGAPSPKMAGSLSAFHYTHDEMKARTKEVADLLVDIGAMPSPREAMACLAQVCVGGGRMDAGLPAPACRHDCAIGFLEALHEHGIKVQLPAAAQPVKSSPSALQAQAAPAAAVRETWDAALQVFDATKAMEAVYAVHAADAPDDKPGAVQRARAARRRL